MHNFEKTSKIVTGSGFDLAGGTVSSSTVDAINVLHFHYHVLYKPSCCFHTVLFC